jgi:hypothetical protein
MFLLAESTHPAAAGEESPRLFEILLDHNRGVRAGEEENSLFSRP